MEDFPETGTSTTLSWSFTQSDFDRFARLSGDDNPIHVDPLFSAQTHFGRTVAHGMLLFGVLSGQLQRHIGPSSSLVVAQEMMFTAPTFADENLLILLEVKNVDQQAGMAIVETAFENPNGSFGLIGTASVYWGDATALITAIESPSHEAVQSEAESYEGMVLGQSAEKTRAFTSADMAEYADLTGDQNPLFVDVEAAQERGLANCMIPLPLLCGLFSDLLGTQLPGRGTNWLKLNVALIRPAVIGEVVTAVVEIIRLRPEKNLLNLKTLCINSNGDTLCVGEALVLARDVLTR